MTIHMFPPRKRRTRQHVIADLSIHHVEGFILEEGHTAQRVISDYGYDLFMSTYDNQGFAEPGNIYLQLKASELWQSVGSDIFFDVDSRDYNLWTLESNPVILVLFDASLRRAYWLAVSEYFQQDDAPRPKKGNKSVRVHVPIRQVVDRHAPAKWCALKERSERSKEVQS